MAMQEMQGSKYHEALFLDAEGNIAEGPGANFFMVKDGALITPPLGTILAGITRATVIEMARDAGFTVTERHISVDEACDAEEAFFTGTAAEVAPIRSINDRQLRAAETRPVTTKLKGIYLDTVYGRSPTYAKYLTHV
jgi:branched-chain amino acid aminotransferase